MKPGDRVKIFNQTLGGQTVDEGAATIKKVLIDDAPDGRIYAKVILDEDPEAGELHRWINLADRIE